MGHIGSRLGVHLINVVQKFGNQLLLLRVHRHHHLFGNPRSGQVVLLQKSAEQFLPGGLRLVVHIDDFPTDHLAFPYPVLRHNLVVMGANRNQDVDIVFPHHGGPLFLAEGPQRPNVVSVFRRLLILQSIRRFHHLSFQLPDDPRILSAQNSKNIPNHFQIFLPIRFSHADSLALSDKIIQAGPGVFRKMQGVAFLQGVHFINHFQNSPHGGAVGVGSKIPILIPLDLPGTDHPGKLFAHGHFNVGIGLVILQEDVVLRHVFLD